MLWNCYLRKGVVYVPTLAHLVPNSGYVAREPITVVPVSDTTALRRAFLETIAKGNPTLPVHLKPDYNSPSVVQSRAGIKSRSAFERTTLSWSIDEKDGEYRILTYRRHHGGGRVVDSDQTIVLPRGSGVEEACDRMIELVQAAAQK
jgi:hypothetical protein